jgi:SAM-dependent methyltransferase
MLIDVGIPGWLWPDDALKLYELAYFSQGDVLEIGCYQGLSTTIMSQAVRDSQEAKWIISLDISPPYIATAQRHVRGKQLDQYVNFVCGDAMLLSEMLIQAKKRFGFVFVDHSHAYKDVAGVCRLLPELVVDGGFCLFHDFNDARNLDLHNLDYGVSRAVDDSLSQDIFNFYGIFGCTALFRKVR